mgnify:CR=1 FL=1
MKRLVMTMLIFLLISPTYAQDISNYLITTDIGPYKRITKGGPSGNILAGADHFGLDHKDAAYGISYVNDESKMWIEVQLTQHSGSDSDKWLLHEVEDGYRKNPEQDNFRGVIREINGNRIFTYRRGTHYSWISNNIVIDIRYTDLQKTKPEPMEIVNAYLQKHPSTIPAMVMDKAHDEKWIKDEMERRLWLCDKWFYQLQLGKVQQKQVFDESVKSMNVFLDYREKYYGISAKDEKNLLSNYLMQNNGTGIRNKLKEYKDWWSINKGNPINL